jgi:tetratricopeptide (TPR) repeat protein
MTKGRATILVMALLTCLHETSAATSVAAEIAPPKAASRDPDIAAYSDDPAQWRRIALTRALDAAATVTDPYRQASAYSNIARVQAQVDDAAATDRTIHLALDAAAKVSEPEFRGWVLHDVVLARIAADDLIGARETADTIEADRPRSAAFAVLATEQLRLDNVAAAFATADRIRDSVSRSEVMRQIVAIEAARGEIEAARTTLRRVDNALYYSIALGDIAVAEVRAGKPDRALALANQARRAYRAQVLGRIALARVDKSDLRGALDTLGKIDDPLYRALVQGRIASTRAASGDTTQARELFATALAMIESVQEKQHRNVAALAQLARMQAANGDEAGASHTLERALAAAAVLEGDRSRDEALEAVARGQARLRDVNGALATAQRIGDRVVRALLVRDIITVQTDTEAAIRAQARVDEFADPLVETAALFGVLGGELLKPGRPRARELIDTAQTAVHKIKEIQLQPAALAALAAARVTLGDVRGGWSIFQDAIEATDSLPRGDQRAEAYVRMVTALNERLLFLGQPAGATKEPEEVIKADD